MSRRRDPLRFHRFKPFEADGRHVIGKVSNCLLAMVSPSGIVSSVQLDSPLLKDPACKIYVLVNAGIAVDHTQRPVMADMFVRGKWRYISRHIVTDLDGWCEADLLQEECSQTKFSIAPRDVKHIEGEFNLTVADRDKIRSYLRRLMPDVL
jgi:hypothetical protein